MSSQSPQKLPNLGRYTIRPPEETSDFRVGSFWRRRQRTSDDEEDNHSLKKAFSDKPCQKMITNTTEDNTNPAKKRISVHRDSVVTPPASLGSDSLTNSTQNAEISDNSDKMSALENRLNREARRQDKILQRVEKKSSEIGSVRVQPADTQSSQQSQLATQSSQQTQLYTLPTERFTLDATSEDTHESVVVSLEPAAFRKATDDDESVGPTPSGSLDGFMLYTPGVPKQMRRKTYPKQMPYDKIMSHVTFVMSGYENPRRSKLRDLAIEMGAKYKPSWNRFCTHLICAFKNTPKYKEVMAEDGRIVREHWIQECSRQRQLLDWRNFKLGKYPYPDSEEEVDVDDLDYALESGYGVKRPAAATAQRH